MSAAARRSSRRRPSCSRRKPDFRARSWLRRRFSPRNTRPSSRRCSCRSASGRRRSSAASARATANACARTLESGEAELVVGTHALIEDGVVFRNLGLAIVDEQHRFGVRQRAKLRAKSRRGPAGDGGSPHTLYMTATPIPRTLAQTKYADLDVTQIDELPPGRTPIETFVLRESPEVARLRVRAQERSRSDVRPTSSCRRSTSRRTRARAPLGELERAAVGAVFPDLRVGLLHGRLVHAREGRGHDVVRTRATSTCLLATTVVEVGVDVPNASVMIILDADRFGTRAVASVTRAGRSRRRPFVLSS